MRQSQMRRNQNVHDMPDQPRCPSFATGGSEEPQEKLECIHRMTDAPERGISSALDIEGDQDGHDRGAHQLKAAEHLNNVVGMIM